MLLAVALRVQGLDLVHFNIDESVASAVASQIATGRRFPLTGIQTSFGFHNPPIYLYILAPLFALSRDPLVAQAFVALLGGVGAVVFAWQAGREWTGRVLGGALAAGIVAACPNAVEHSRRLWGHDLIVFWSALAVWGAVLSVRRQRAVYLAISFLAAGCAQSVHLSGAVLWLVGVPVLARRMGRPAGAWKAVVAGAVGLALNYLPWIIDQGPGGFSEVRYVMAVLAGGGAGRDLGMAVRPLAAWLLVLADFWNNDLLGATRPWMVSPLAAVASLALTLLGGAMLLGTAARLANLARTNTCQERSLALALLLPIVVTPVLFGVLLRAAVPPYQLPALVPAAVGAAGLLVAMADRFGKRAIAACLAAYLVAAVALTIEVRRALARGEGDAPSLREKIALAEALRGAVGGDSFALLQDGRAPAAGVDVAWVFLLYRARIETQVLPTPAPGQRLFIVHTNATKLRPPVAVGLRRLPLVAETPHGELREVPPAEREAWLELVRRFSSAG